MQNSHSKITLQSLLKEHWSIIVIVILTPLLLYMVLPILPTHDDWCGTTKPDFRPFFIKEHFFFYGYHWRPFDTWIGYIAGRNPQLLYPAFNHVMVVIGHLLGALAIYKLLTVLRFNTASKNIATLLFFVVPATMATVSAIDSQNQVYALFFDVIAFLLYIKLHKSKYIVWILLIFIATLCKENGLMWALICPLLAFGFNFIDKKTLKKDLLIGCGIMVSYAFLIAIQPKDIIIHPDYEPGPLKVVKNFIKFLYTSFITNDYIYLLHQPSRNWLLAAVSTLLTLPLFYLVFIRNIKLFKEKAIICTILCLLIAVGPHILTVFSMMHTYAGLPLIAILTAYSINRYQQRMKYIWLAFVLFIIAAIAIDIHLIDSSIKSGLIGKRMAKEAVQKTGSSVKSVYVIIIEDDYPKLSSFCVIPNEAFGWGLAARYETNYQWPEIIKDTTIERTDDYINQVNLLVEKTKNKKQYEAVWIVNHDQVEVIK